MPTAAEQATAAAAAGFWVDQAASASQQLTETATASTAAAWLAFSGWYDASAVADLALNTAGISLATQEAVGAMFSEYVAQTTALLTRSPRIVVPNVSLAPVRNGVDPVVVHSRPAEVYRQTYALTGDDELALQRAVDRLTQLVETDIQLAGRQMQQDSMDELEVRRYRRVLRPELSETGPCGLCVVAADRLYNISDLMPMHGRCKCLTLPVFGEFDPGLTLNAADLKRIYAAAGSTTDGRALKAVRVSVNEHGEVGPVLTYRGQTFTGPEDLGAKAPGNPALLEERLAKLQGVLAKLEQSQGSIPDRAARMDYQRTQIARTRRDAAA